MKLGHKQKIFVKLSIMINMVPLRFYMYIGTVIVHFHGNQDIKWSVTSVTKNLHECCFVFCLIAVHCFY